MHCTQLTISHYVGYYNVAHASAGWQKHHSGLTCQPASPPLPCSDSRPAASGAAMTLLSTWHSVITAYGLASLHLVQQAAHHIMATSTAPRCCLVMTPYTSLHVTLAKDQVFSVHTCRDHAYVNSCVHCSNTVEKQFCNESHLSCG
jgi:hypothetical protein